VTDVARELAGKRLELLKETVPKASRVAVLSWKPAGPDYAAEKNEIELAARASRIDLQLVERYANNRSRIIKLVAKSRLPAVYQDWVFVQAGGLMSYGTNRARWRRRIASYVDKILKGAKPADLPVEQPTKFELVINLNAAKQIGLTIPPNVLARADPVIK
jgi:putative ABC transport system substrate-binding protein